MTFGGLPQLGALYGAQGLVYGFAGGVLIPQLAAHNVELDQQTGLLALGSLPWVAKLPVGLALDHLGLQPGRVASFAMLACAATLGAWAWQGEPTSMPQALAWSWLVVNLCMATQDVAADTVALDRVRADARGRAQAVMWGGHTLGSTLLGTLVMGMVAMRLGLGAAFGALAVGVACVGIAPLSSGRTVARRTTDVQAVLKLLRRPQTWLVSGVAGFVLVGDVGTSAVSGELLIHRLRWPMARVVETLPLWDLAGKVLGFVLAGWAVDRLRHVHAWACGSAVLGGLWIAFGLASAWWETPGFVLALVLLQNTVSGVFYVGLYAWLMDRTDSSLRATHYAVLTSLLNLPRAWVPPQAGKLLEGSSFELLFTAAGCLQFAIGLAVFSAVFIARGRQATAHT